MLEKSGQGETSAFIVNLETYLPQLVSEKEIREWILANVDFSSFKNKMQAMGPIMAHFGSSADGTIVKSVLQTIET
jgi:uncharacterized protein YqeY